MGTRWPSRRSARPGRSFAHRRHCARPRAACGAVRGGGGDGVETSQGRGSWERRRSRSQTKQAMKRPSSTCRRTPRSGPSGGDIFGEIGTTIVFAGNVAIQDAPVQNWKGTSLRLYPPEKTDKLASAAYMPYRKRAICVRPMPHPLRRDPRVPRCRWQQVRDAPSGVRDHRRVREQLSHRRPAHGDHGQRSLQPLRVRHHLGQRHHRLRHGVLREGHHHRRRHRWPLAGLGARTSSCLCLRPW